MEPSWQEFLDLTDDAVPTRSQLPPPPTPSSASSNPKPVSPSSDSFLLRRCSLPPDRPTPIPGPAGTVQSAILRRRKTDTVMESGEECTPTQEFVRRVFEDAASAFDEDFDRLPWLSAVHFVRRQGLVDGDGAIGIPLSAIKSRMDTTDKVAQVVAIIKSCSPNGLGDMMVTLKDPTGTINASIHRRVFADGELGKNISLGAVLILQKVAVFSPARSSQYLNITHNNLVKVISKDGDIVEMNDDITVEDLALGRNEMPFKPRKQFVSSSRIEGIVESVRHAMDNQNAHNLKEVDGDKANSRDSDDGCNIARNNVLLKENLPLGQDVVNGMKKALGTGLDVINSEAGFYQEQNPLGKITGSNRLDVKQGSVNKPGLVDVSNHPRDQSNLGTKQKDSVTSRSSLPEWTEEQLDQLFAFD